MVRGHRLLRSSITVSKKPRVIAAVTNKEDASLAVNAAAKAADEAKKETRKRRLRADALRKAVVIAQ
jgi:hypothetical protein